MNCKDFIKNLKKEFNKFGVNDVFVKDDSLILNIDKEENMPAYKIAVTFLDEGYLSIYAYFKHNAVLKKEYIELLNVINTFNEQSFLKFIANKEHIKIEYNIPELDDKDIDKIIRIITIIPNILFDYRNDLIKYLD